MYKDKDGTIVIPSNLEKLPKCCTYDGNPQIKRANVKIAYEPEHALELARCASDVNYFAANFVYIIDPDKGKTLINVRDYQKDLLTHLDENRFSIILASRQIGKSLTSAIYLLHYILFNKDKKVVILANKAKIAKEIFQKVRTAYEKLPYWMQIGVEEWQKTACTLENGSSCSAEATTADGLRGIAGNIIFLDEFAFIKRNIADDFFTSMYPTISASQESKIIVVSTPNGLNHFYSLWTKANKGLNSFKPFRVDWWQVPGRDENWKEETIKNIGQKKFDQEYGNSFLGSSKTLIDGTFLETMDQKEPIEYKKDFHLRIYEQPVEGHIYSIGVDTAKGIGGDYSVCQVIDITAYPFKQVAVYRNNTIRPREFGNVVNDLGVKYNDAFLMIENNDIGHAVCDYVWKDLEYENLVNFSYDAKKKRTEIGIRSTRKTKSIGCDLIKDIIEELDIDIIDPDTIYELSVFIEIRTGIFQADDGEFDDTVTALLWALFILKTNYIDKEDIILHKDGDDSTEEIADPILGDENPYGGLDWQDVDVVM